MKLILENFRKFINEGDDKVSKKISYLMDKEDKPQDQAVAIALSMKDRGELEEGFKSGEKITHDEYGDGVVTHPGTKNTDVAVKFEKDTGRGKSIKVSRGSLKKAVKESEEDAMRGAVRPGAGIEDIPQPEDEETVDRAFDSPEGRLVTLIRAREVLGKMTRAELEDLATDLDASMVATLRHILSNKMYAPTGEFDSLPQIGDDPRDQSPLEEGREREVSTETKLAMARGTAEQEAKYHKVRDQGYSDSQARRFVYGRSYSAMGQR